MSRDQKSVKPDLPPPKLMDGIKSSLVNGHGHESLSARFIAKGIIIVFGITSAGIVGPPYVIFLGIRNLKKIIRERRQASR